MASAKAIVTSNTNIHQLWDVCSDQEAVDLIRNVEDPSQAAKMLVDHALTRFSTDNLSCMVVRFDKAALMESHKEKPIGVEGDAADIAGKVSEADKIVISTKQKIADGTPAVGVSGSNSGRGHDPVPLKDNESFKPTALQGSVDEGPEDSDAPEVNTDALPNLGTTTTPSAGTISQENLKLPPGRAI